MEKNITETNDDKLLGFCSNSPKSVNDIARHLNISGASISQKIKELEKRDLIVVSRKGKGKKTLVRTKGKDKTIDYFLEMLKELKRNGGEMKRDKFITLIPFAFEDAGAYDKFQAPMRIMYIQPALVEHYIKITPIGEKFLEDNSK